KLRREREPCRLELNAAVVRAEQWLERIRRPAHILSRLWRSRRQPDCGRHDGRHVDSTRLKLALDAHPIVQTERELTAQLHSGDRSIDALKTQDVVGKSELSRDRRRQ